MNKLQEEIIKELNVCEPLKGETKADFIKRIIVERSEFLNSYLQYAKANGYVLGLSGGVDSFVASMLVKNAGLKLISISLPYGTQSDMDDVQASRDIIKPDQFLIHNIKHSVDEHITMIDRCCMHQDNIDLDKISDDRFNLLKGNVCARERMAVQYSYGSIYNCLVIGTDHATEAVTGFYTKFGDGAADVLPLAGLTKDIIYELAKYFNAPKNVLKKAPSAGLWENQTDEQELGLTYNEICSYLHGQEIDDKPRIKLENKYRITEHKRHLPVTIYDKWWIEKQ